METQIITCSSDGSIWLSDEWTFLKSGISDSRGQNTGYYYKGDRTKALDLFEESQKNMLEKMSEYYSQKFV